MPRPGPDQWYLRYDLAAATHGINVIPVWDDYSGAGVDVAVFDQGIDFFHNDLIGNISFLRSMDAHTNAVGPFNGVPLTADDNHGTLVAGLIAANGILVGAAYEATLISE